MLFRSHDIKPQNEFHAWMVDQMAVTSVRIDHNGRIERRLRDRAVLHAEKFWDDDRRLETERLGSGLASHPAIVAEQLRRTPHGCDWMIGRWSNLARHADLQLGKWTEAQTSLAYDLLGVRVEDRVGEPGEVIDLEGRVIEPAPDPASLARREVASLLKRKEEVTGLDDLDRALARADYVPEPTEEIRRLRRHDAELHRRLMWFIKQINTKSPYVCTSPRVFDHFQPNPVIQPEPSPPAAEVEAEVEADEAPPEVVTENPPPIPSARLEKKLRAADKRRDARHRKLERRRA